MKLRQLGAAVDASDGFERGTRQLVAARGTPVRKRRDRGRKHAVAVSLRELTGDEGVAALGLRLGRAVTQHQMREIEIEFMRRHVRALRHEAHVAKRAGLDDRCEIGRLHLVEFAGRAFVDQIEKARETVAEIEAAPAPVTDVEDAAHFLIELPAIVEVWVVPIEGMAGRCFGTAFFRAAHRPRSPAQS